MAAEVHRTIAVCGATGRQGGSVTRRLLDTGWSVRALTRRPGGRRARALADIGATVVRADMEDPASLRHAFDGVEGVYSVQNGVTSGFEREVLQGRNVADAAKATGVRHLVYGSAGPGRAGTGVPSWESKLLVEEHIKTVELPFTILRPMAFMELMTDRSFYPAVGTWRIFPRLTGDRRPIPWLSVHDLGAVAEVVLAQPDEFVGKELTLASDVQTLADCRLIYREVVGRSPRSFTMPLWLFDRFTRKDVTTMWRWLRTGTVDLDTATTRAILPSAWTVREWLSRTWETTAKRA
jgi:uncharacterized protein YbjT (DUF2867 family)